MSAPGDAGRDRTDADVELLHRTERVGAIEMHWVEAGEGPLVVLLHGFPEFWYSWRRQLRDLAAAGFRAVAPDQRGYNLTSKPSGVGRYRIGALGDDVVALMRHLGEERAHVAGHDWGGMIAWHLGARRPDRVRRLAVLNAPHPDRYRRLLSRSDQLLRSWYMLYFQLPRLPEATIRAFDFAVLERILRRDPVREQAFSADEIAAYKAALARPGALTGAVNWYRANLFGRRGGGSRRGGGEHRRGGKRSDGRRAAGSPDEAESDAVEPAPSEAGGGHRVEVPTLLVWGERDRYLNPRLAEGLERWVPDLRTARLPEASHWVQADAPDRVSRLLVDFFGEVRGA